MRSASSVRTTAANDVAQSENGDCRRAARIAEENVARARTSMQSWAELWWAVLGAGRAGRGRGRRPKFCSEGRAVLATRWVRRWRGARRGARRRRGRVRRRRCRSHAGCGARAGRAGRARRSHGTCRAPTGAVGVLVEVGEDGAVPAQRAPQGSASRPGSADPDRDAGTLDGSREEGHAVDALCLPAIGDRVPGPCGGKDLQAFVEPLGQQLGVARLADGGELVGER